ncbi:uncharacterized protein LOC133835891 [Drosophila sulfurigaster albostrigata]|uniref:uncharacterized protein LOC133835891 n=1 Tax=Drosophila sulfurigaster albostrigata TaxID=89887 RepID=UPI002D21D45E|nr:uncharacterized protein LOC133835891 [Drosophila sulfurigaster albostrigata]
MGDLPKERASCRPRPFRHTGVDFAGPFEVKNYTGRACLITKGYVCVFVCFSTKAILLEATSDLTTEKFLAAFSRFIARRECSQKMHSDNGKTVVGTDKEISTDFLEATRECIIANHGHQSLSWHFNPPGAPLMGGPLISVLEPEINQQATSILNRWQRLKALLQQFCFRSEDKYLKKLHKRTKWQSPTRNLQIGDMVQRVALRTGADNVSRHRYKSPSCRRAHGAGYNPKTRRQTDSTPDGGQQN